MEAGGPGDVRRALEAALTRRRDRLPADTDLWRAVDGELDGVEVDCFGAVAVLSLFRAATPEEERALAEAVAELLPAKSVYLKRRPKEARRAANESADWVAPPVPLVGPEVPSLVCRELGLSFEIRPANGLSVGLYVDARDARAWVRAQAGGARVLNGFAYTCGFGVAAGKGGAARAVNVDLSRKVLDWGARNTELNALLAERRDFISGDVFEWLKRFAKKDERFELVILDPPGFSTAKEGRFTAARDYHRLVAAALPVVAQRGRLLCLCNVAALSERELEAQVLRGASARRGRVVERFGASPIDCAQPSRLKVLVVEVD